MKRPIPQFVLASGSPRRRELLQAAGYLFEVIPASDSAECGVCSSSGPADLVTTLAFRKAADVVKTLSQRERDGETLVLAADTVAECDGSILGKPRDEEDARRILELLSGRTHRVWTGVCLWKLMPNTRIGDQDQVPTMFAEQTLLRMDTLSEEMLDEYLASGEWEGKAGGFGYQDRLGWVHILEGSESNVVGLPMERIRTLLPIPPAE